MRGRLWRDRRKQASRPLAFQQRDLYAFCSMRNEETVEEQALREAATGAARNAYAPYSGFCVGAAVLLASGQTVTGCNVENVSYRLTCCAEQTAIACAVSLFGPAMRIVAVAVANQDGSVACQPCGACRQTIAEFADRDCLVHYPGKGGVPETCTLGDLLPAGFHAASLQ